MKYSMTLVAAFCMIGVTAEARVKSPNASGGAVSLVETDIAYRYVHVFTSASDVQTFVNTSDKPLSLRCLAVGGGGRGGVGHHLTGNGGGGGGGGGVLEVEGVPLAPGGRLDIRIGAGATSSAAAGATAISNGVEEIALVPGGGNGSWSTEASSGTAATEGAAGGGGSRAKSAGAAGTYASSILGMTYPMNAGGNRNGIQGGGGGGGAGGAGKNDGSGGSGVYSDITGAAVCYGSGGGGGGGVNGSWTALTFGGKGGARAGDGGTIEIVEAGGVMVTNLIASTAPEANSGAGGAGGLGGEGTSTSTQRRYTNGAAGIVIVSYEVSKIPFVGGVVSKIAQSGDIATFIHVFTNTVEAVKFSNTSEQPVAVRLLAVGGGGSAGDGNTTTGNGGGGGGGGGVVDTNNFSIAAGAGLDIRIGKGSTSLSVAAGATVISNGTEEVLCVPGGGNGSKSTSASSGTAATEGAAGGGGSRAQTAGAAGTFASSVLGVAYSMNAGGRGSIYGGGGGGGAGYPGKNFTDGAIGGEGLASDITGASLVYGSGGGGGGNIDDVGKFNNGGIGGTRAGNGGYINVVVGEESSTTNFVKATSPVANSGGGGGGGVGGKGSTTAMRTGSDGADGVVVIRYDWNVAPKKAGFIIFVQ